MTRIMMITGGSRGIGAAMARKAAAAGYDICLSYVSRPDAAEGVAADVRARGQRALVVQADTGIEADIVRLFETCDAELGRCTDLIANAGITGPVARVEEITAEILERVMDINVNGVFYSAREAIKRISTRHGGPGGSIVVVSSRASELGGAGQWVHYAASKAAMDTFTVGLAQEVAAEGIRVNAVNPGLIETDIHASAGLHDRLEKLGPTVPMKRTGTAEEVADLMLYLCSDAASYVTGTCVKIGGGR
ncbi:MAG: SDR family oxidoreductase [Pseudomonadota bacterium]